MSKTSSYLSAAAAFFMWGAWAYYVNADSGMAAGLTAGLAQGAASFVITLIMVYIATFFYGRLKPLPLAWCLSALLTVSCTGTGLVLIHTLAQTPDILTTITPALLVALAFCLVTTWKLHQQ